MLPILRWVITLVLGIGLPVWVYLTFFVEEPVFPPEEDVALGRQSVQAIEQQPDKFPLLPETEYPEAYAQLRQLVGKLADSDPMQYSDLFAYREVRIIHDDKTLNAFCIPGGFIYVYSGLIHYLDAQDHLAGVLGHEIAHAELRHSSVRLQKEYGARKLLELALWTPSIGVSDVIVAKFLSDLMGLRYSRDQEANADRMSVRYLADTDYACDGAAGYFKKLLEEGKDAPIPESLSDHPDSAARVADIQREAAALGCKTELGDQSGWQTLQTSLPPPEKKEELEKAPMNRENLAMFSLTVMALFVIAIILQQLRPLLRPFSFAGLLSILFQPLLRFLRGKGVPTALSLVAALVVSGLVVFLAGNLLYASAGPLVAELPQYQAKFNQVVGGIAEGISAVIQKLGIRAEHLDVNTLLGATTVTAEYVSATSRTFVDFLGKAALVLLFNLFMLAGPGTLSAKVKRAFRAEQAKQVNDALRRIEFEVRCYLVLKVLLSGVTGVVTGLLLWMLRVDFPLFWGSLAFLLGFIPNVGPLVAVGAPFVLSLLQFDGLARPLLVLVLLGAAYIILGSVVQPKMMAASLNLSVLLVLVALIFWGILWGTWGMILAIPLTTTFRIVFENVEPLRPLAVLMSARAGKY